MQVLPDELGVNLGSELLEELQRYAIGPISVDVVEQERLQTVGVEVARLILVVDCLVEEVSPADLAL